MKSLPFSSRLIKETHKTLLQGVRGQNKLPGEFRSSQNWIGGASIEDATFVPPIHATINELMGDLEKFAIEKVFGNQMPFCTTNKWKIGHTLGASGTLSIEMAILMLQNQQFITIPYLENNQKNPTKIETIMVNAVGFGGNAVSIILQRKK